MRTAREQVVAAGMEHLDDAQGGAITDAIRAAQIEALKWALTESRTAGYECGLIKDRIAELEADAVRPAGEVGTTD